jgi:GPI-anchor transamidase subunit K
VGNGTLQAIKLEEGTSTARLPVVIAEGIILSNSLGCLQSIIGSSRKRRIGTRTMMHIIYCCYFCCCCWCFPGNFVSVVNAAADGRHTSNYAVILSASRYWFNYRHNSNALSIYKLLKQNGFDDENIILMLADDFITNPRNPVKNGIFTKPGVTQQLQQQQQHLVNSILDPIDTEIDYRGEDVTVQNFVNVLLGIQPANMPHVPVLQTDEDSHILIYMTGHGGDQFFKFLDIEEILATQLSTTFRQMHQHKRYREILVVADTCQAYTMGDYINNNETTPNITIIGSSLKGQSSYAHHADPYLGLSVIEKYTYHFIEYITRNDMKLQKSIKHDMIDPYTYQQQRANIGYTDTYSIRKVDDIPMADFFANVQWKQNEIRKIQRNEDRFLHNNLQLISTETFEFFSQLISTDLFTSDHSITLKEVNQDDTNENIVKLNKSSCRGSNSCDVNTKREQQAKKDDAMYYNSMMEPKDTVFRILVLVILVSTFFISRRRW